MELQYISSKANFYFKHIQHFLKSIKIYLFSSPSINITIFKLYSSLILLKLNYKPEFTIIYFYSLTFEHTPLYLTTALMLKLFLCKTPNFQSKHFNQHSYASNYNHSTSVQNTSKQILLMIEFLNEFF